MLRVARCSARKARTQALNQMRSLISTAPDDDPRRAARPQRVPAPRTRRGLPARAPSATSVSVTKLTLRTAGPPSAIALEAEVAELDAILEPARRRDRTRAGRRSSASAPTSPRRCSSPPATTPNGSATKRPSLTSAACRRIDASSGKHERHRLNRGGDRQANSALWRIVITRMVYDPRTRDYIERRMKEGLTKKEAIRCLKRYIAREVYNHLPRQQLALDSP